MEPTRYMTIANEYREKYQHALIEIGNLERALINLREEMEHWKRAFYELQKTREEAQAHSGILPKKEAEPAILQPIT